jgi:CubicO group peptidase (beta-lactamase class C family)
LNIDPLALNAFLEQKHRVLRMPGMAVAVVSDGQVAYLRGLGAAAPGRSMTAQTPLILGSLSKSLTALAILQLIEADKLALDIPVQEYIPWFRLADAVASASITVKHLLEHTSGISRYDGRVFLAGRGGKTIEQSVRDLRSLKLTKPVGTTYQYSNINYLILGFVIEVMSGHHFGEYIQQHIFTPLGMLQSFTNEDAARWEGLATGHRWWFGVPVPFRAPYLDDALPAAFVAASVEDLAHYVLALLSDGQFDGISVLSPAGIADLFRPQVPIATGGSYGFGWRIDSLAGVPIIRHGGEVSNFLAEMVLIPQLKLGIIVLMNCNNGLVPLVLPEAIRVASEVVRFLLRIPQVPAGRRWSVRSFYALLDVALAALSGYQLWSLVQVARFGSLGLGLAALGEVALAVAAWRLIPRRVADAPWSLLWLYVPDLVIWLAIFSSCSLLKVAIFVFGRFLNFLFRLNSREAACRAE